jgi:hypothetical protein
VQPPDRAQLERAGYAVQYREFDGPHTVPPAIAREAVAWFAPRRPEPRSRAATQPAAARRSPARSSTR